MASLISNPPYNMKWESTPFAQIQKRFFQCELPPESNANYAFILTGIEKIDKRAAFIMPCTILNSKNKKEKSIRKYLIEKNYVDSVIMCPNRMFEATDISTCIIVFDKQKTTAQVTLVDMRKTYETEQREQRGQYGGPSHENRVYKKEVKVFSDENMEKALLAISERRNDSEFCKTVTIEDLKVNDYTLVPSIYIEAKEQEERHREYKDIVRDINRIIKEKNACKLTINGTLAKTIGFDLSLYKADQENVALNDILKKIGSEPLEKENYFSVTKNKNEIKFENGSKDMLSCILMLIMNMWKQHIFYLNQEENRYLAELRDALILDLMTGKIKIE